MLAPYKHCKIYFIAQFPHLIKKSPTKYIFVYQFWCRGWKPVILQQTAARIYAPSPNSLCKKIILPLPITELREKKSLFSLGSRLVFSPPFSRVVICVHGMKEEISFRKKGEKEELILTHSNFRPGYARAPLAYGQSWMIHLRGSSTEHLLASSDSQ